MGCRAMESVQRVSRLLSPIPVTSKPIQNSSNPRFLILPFHGLCRNQETLAFNRSVRMQKRTIHASPIGRKRLLTPSSAASSGWLFGFGEKNPVLPEIVKAGDPVLHEPAREVDVDEIGTDKMEKIIEDMIAVMRKAPGVGLAAPQIGIPLKIIVLEDTKQYISYSRKEEVEAQDRRPFDLLVILNPKLKKKNNKRALFFEGCLSVNGFRGMVERFLEVEVTGLGRDGRPIKVDASGWQARIIQHECDHLEGTIYVDKMVPRTFRTVENLDLPLPKGCPTPGILKV